jgi:hypothetical protein
MRRESRGEFENLGFHQTKNKAFFRFITLWLWLKVFHLGIKFLCSINCAFKQLIVMVH